MGMVYCREELKELRKQMADIEKSLMQQVVTNEKRADESLVLHYIILYMYTCDIMHVDIHIHEW